MHEPRCLDPESQVGEQSYSRKPDYLSGRCRLGGPGHCPRCPYVNRHEGATMSDERLKVTAPYHKISADSAEKRHGTNEIDVRRDPDGVVRAYHEPTQTYWDVPTAAMKRFEGVFVGPARHMLRATVAQAKPIKARFADGRLTIWADGTRLLVNIDLEELESLEDPEDEPSPSCASLLAEPES